MKHHNSIETNLVQSPLGAVRLAATPQGLCGLWFLGQRHEPDASAWVVATDNPHLAQTSLELSQYFNHQRTDFSVALDLSAGTPFQQCVWQALLSVPFGKTSGYGALSAAMGRPSSARAVGSAIGRNPISIVVPCHRVIGADGSLTGYAGGLDRKTALLTLEGAL